MKEINKSVLVLGGYGNFGKRIVKALTKAKIHVLVNGRSKSKAKDLLDVLPNGLAEIACFDVTTELARSLDLLKPTIVINTVGPFQGADYRIAKTCIEAGVHYIDLADGREFVRDFSKLDKTAKSKDVIAITGASTVPGLSSAVIDHLSLEFSQLDQIAYGISPGQKSERGLATTQGVLSYIGKVIPSKASENLKPVFGWQNLHRNKIPTAGNRWFANCDIPDLDLFPQNYGFKKMQFGAGLELGFMHLGLWLASWLVRLGVPLGLARFSKPLLTISNWFDAFGTNVGAMYLELRGKDMQGVGLTKKWYIVAGSGDGPQIPTIPAIFLAKQILAGRFSKTGARPCISLLSLEEYLGELEHFDVRAYED